MTSFSKLLPKKSVVQCKWQFVEDIIQLNMSRLGKQKQQQSEIVGNLISAAPGEALPKNTWRVCAATLPPIFPPVTEWPPLYFFYILLSPNDSHFQNVLSLKDPILRKKNMLSPNDFFFFFRSKCFHWMTPIFTNKWPPLDMYPIFVWKEGFMIYIAAKQKFVYGKEDPILHYTDRAPH